MKKLASITTALLLLALPAARSFAKPQATDDAIIIKLAPAPGAIDNPLKGWCPYPTAAHLHQSCTMTFHYATWKELEPVEGQFQFEKWEQEKWDQPDAQGKHVVFRVYIDYPRKQTGLPDWLKKQGVSLTPYEDQGGGLSPDYNHPQLVVGLEKLIAALGQRYNNHPRVAFIEIGLLGFWGEWHCYPQNEKLYASPATETRVLQAYRRAFPDKMLMVRYARETTGNLDWIGFHDDLFPDDTDGKDWKFLPKLRRYGRDNNWRRAPIGGEMQPGAAPKWLGPEYKTTQTMIDRSHFTWVGPYCPAMHNLAELPPAEVDQFRTRCQALVRQMGYDFRLTHFKHPRTITADQPFPIAIRGQNIGVSPFYYPWQCEFALINPAAKNAAEKVVATHATSWDIRQWQPDRVFTQQAKLHFKNVPPGTYHLALGIRDPWTQQPAITFANNVQQIQGWSILSSIEVRTP